MARLRLSKLLRGESLAMVQRLIDLLDEPISVVDGAGRVLIGPEPTEFAGSVRISVDGQQLGEVRGGAGAQAIGDLLCHLGARELEKVQLANETLGRYKELTLLYNMSDRLSRMFDFGDVARTVVEETLRAVGGIGSAIYLHDRRTDTLVALAVSSDDQTRVLPAGSGVEGRVLQTGQAEFVEEVDTALRSTMDAEINSLICAPLRSGERVFGVLRVTHSRATLWNSGDLKLVSSIAAQAAAALQGAELYRSRMREVALKHHLQRYVSPLLVDVARQTASPGAPGHLALVFCDLSRAESGSGASTDLVTEMEARITRAMAVMLEHGAVIDIPQGEMILGAFHDEVSEVASRRAVFAGLELVSALARGAPDADVPGLGITAASLGAAEGDAVGEALSAAALLQAASGGRVLVDYAVASALGSDPRPTQVSDVDLPGARNIVFEVRP